MLNDIPVKARWISAAYLSWVVFHIVFTIGGIGDGGVSSHLWLLLTGMPASLISWVSQHGSLCAVLIAGLTGWIQWTAIAICLGKRKQKSRA